MTAAEGIGQLSQAFADDIDPDGRDGRLAGLVLDGVNVGLVSVDPTRDIAHVNQSAAALIGGREGSTTAAAFATSIRNLARRATNQADIAVALRKLKHDPLAEVRATWTFAEAPTHLGVVSKPDPYSGPGGRVWAFYDNSAIAQAIEESNHAFALLRATSDAMLEPQALLEAVWHDGEIVDFVYRDVNRATCEYLGITRDELVGQTLMTTMPNVGPSGLLARFSHCTVTHEPLVIDDITYDNEILGESRQYDIRAVHVRDDLINLTWRDVTERSLLNQRIAASEEQFRLLAENVADVVVRIDDRGIITWISNSVGEALGAPPEYWIGRSGLDLAIPSNIVKAKTDWAKLTSGKSQIGRGRVLGADGVEHWVHLYCKPFHGSNGSRDGIVMSFRVIDDEVAAEEQVQALINQRDAQNRSLARHLQAQTVRLTAELDSAARYVSSILPGHLDGPVEVVSRCVPSLELGGDTYDYRWIDDDHLICYLIDVSGHGVEPALLSVSAHNLLRSRTLDPATLLDPEWVLRELNRTFQMDQQFGHFFTIWYGVYEASSRTLRFASAGHPPAIALEAGTQPVPLSTDSIPIGMGEDIDVNSRTYEVPPGTEILLYSDGAYEVELPGGQMGSLQQFIDIYTEHAAVSGWTVDDLVDRLRARSATGIFDDDCTLVRLTIR